MAVKLGLLITTDRHLDHIIGYTNAAVAKGHEISLFCMDKGTKLLEEKRFTDLCRAQGAVINICRHSAEQHGINLDKLSKDIICGSQFNNAMMNHEADKVISL